MKKGPRKSASKAQAKPAAKEDGDGAAAVDSTDWLGEAGNDEALKLGGADDSDDDEGEEDDESEEEEDDDATGVAEADELPDEDAEAVVDPAAAQSRLLARAAEATPDLAALKQRIQDDVTLLTNWRKSKQLGHGRRREEVFKSLTTNCATYYGYAEELAEYFLQMFSAEEAIKFFEANDQARPLTIRTNSLKTRRSSLIQALSSRRANVDPIGDWTKVGLKVYDSQVPIGATPEYLGGQYMIQSASSLIPVMALAPQQNETILDMAAAPGGKTTYIGQLMRNSGTLFANDYKKERCKSLVANAHRMGLTNVVVTNLDGRKLQPMLPKMDRVLLDAPCSGSGIIARDPSIKVKRGAKDFEENSHLQKEMLATAIDLVDAGSKTGGFIVYSTCSVSIEENEAVVDHALKVRNVELVSFTSSVNFGVEGFARYRERRFHPSMNMCRRYYPHVHNMDGFFVAKFRKISNEIPERAKKSRWKGTEHIKVWGEEHWTPEMMDSVVEFPEKAVEEAAEENAPPAKPLNKRDRKKLKRAEQLKQRAAEAARAAPSSSAAEHSTKEPEEEPKPRKRKLGLKKQAKASSSKKEAQSASEGKSVEEESKLRKRKLVKKKKSENVEDPKPKKRKLRAKKKTPADGEDAAPSRKTKRRKVAA